MGKMAEICRACDSCFVTQEMGSCCWRAMFRANSRTAAVLPKRFPLMAFADLAGLCFFLAAANAVVLDAPAVVLFVVAWACVKHKAQSVRRRAEVVAKKCLALG